MVIFVVGFHALAQKAAETNKHANPRRVPPRHSYRAFKALSPTLY